LFSEVCTEHSPMDAQSVLVCESDPKAVQTLQKSLGEKWRWEYATNGREAQTKIYKQNFGLIFLDIDLENHSGVEVLRYIKTAKPQVRVVLVCESKARLSELGFDAKELQRLGIVGPLIKPVSASSMLAMMDDLNRIVSWKSVQEVASTQAGAETTMADSKFTRIRVEEFFSGEVSVFDIYLRLNKDKYIKIFNKGEQYNPERLKKYAETKQGEWLYFLTAERAAFINYLNEMSQRVMSSPNFTNKQRIGLIKNIADQYISEIETRGIRPEIVEEGKKMCENMLTMARDDKGLATLLQEFEAIDPQAYSEAFLTAFFASMIVAKLPWGSKNTVEKVVMGSLMQDIGKLKLPPNLREKKEQDMDARELEIWRKHPQLGVEMLDTSPSVNEAVKQIVYQHHELVNGSGFPNGLTGLKIFPLAKVVSFAHDLANFLRQEGLAPLEGVKTFLRRPGELEKYDPLMVKSFLLCFTDKEKQKKGKIS